MRTYSGLILALCAVPLVLGCNHETTTETTGDQDVLDVRVPIPPADPAYVDFVSGELEIPAGEERMLCTHFHYDGPDMAFDLQEGLQGKFGHHAVLLTAKKPLPPGTSEDCSDVSDMAKYDAFTVGGQELPAGYGVFLPAGRDLVLQAHYLNTGTKAILIRDVARLRKIAMENVKEWAAIYVTNSLNLNLPPSQKTTIEFDCTVEKDVRLLFVGGHMHEHGSAVELRYGPDADHLETMFRTDPWEAQYRDDPPMTLFLQNPKPLPQGTLLHTKCEFNNATPEEISFPKEMCVSFGYAAGSKEPTVCSVGN